VTAELRYAFLFWRWRHSRKPAIKYHATLAATTTPRKRRTGLDRTPAISGEFSSWLVGTGFMREGRKMRLLIDGSMGTLLLVGPELKVVVMRTTVRVSAGLFLDPPQLFQPFPGSAAALVRILPQNDQNALSGGYSLAGLRHPASRQNTIVSVTLGICS